MRRGVGSKKCKTTPQPAQPPCTNYWAPLTQKQHHKEHRPQRPSEDNNPTKHAKGTTGDCPGPFKELEVDQQWWQERLVQDRLLVVCEDQRLSPNLTLFLVPNNEVKACLIARAVRFNKE